MSKVDDIEDVNFIEGDPFDSDSIHRDVRTVRLSDLPYGISFARRDGRTSTTMQQVWVNFHGGRCLVACNNADGDCLFVAISQQLEGALSPLELRASACRKLEAHLDIFEAQLIDLGMHMQQRREIPAHIPPGGLAQAALQMLHLPWTWGGAECIAALCRSLGRVFLVHQEEGGTIEFHPPAGTASSALPPIRIVYRYGRTGPGNDRSHYESAVRFEPGDAAAPAPSEVTSVMTREIGTQTVSLSPTIAVSSEDESLPDIHIPPPRPRQGITNAAPRSSVSPVVSSRKLRPRLSTIPQAYRQENFSDPEEVGERTEDRKWRECIICQANVGRYAMIGCGAFPICSACLQRWYVQERHALCMHCNGPMIGWVKIFNQN